MKLSPSAKLLKRLREECGLDLPSTAYVYRTRYRRDDYESGAFHIFILGQDTRTIGSEYTVTDLLKAERLVVTNQFHGSELVIRPSS